MLLVRWKQFLRCFLVLCIFIAVFVLKFNDDVLRFKFYAIKPQTKLHVNSTDIEFNENNAAIVNQQQFELDNFTFPEFRWCLDKDVTPPFDCLELFNGTV